MTSLKPGCFVLGASSLLLFVGGFFIIRKATRETAKYLDKQGLGGDGGHDGGDDEEEERAWRQRRRDEQNGGTASTHSTSMSRSSLEEERESQQNGASSLLPLSRPLLSSDELAGGVGGRMEQGQEGGAEPPRGMRGWFRSWGARHERPPPRAALNLDAPNDAAQ